MPCTDEKLKEYYNVYQKYGEDAHKELGITAETLSRRLREYRERFKLEKQPKIQANPSTKTVLQKIADRYTKKELDAIAEGGRIMPGQGKVPIIDFEGDTIKLGFLTDSHMGSIYFKEDYYYQMLEQFKKEKVELVLHSGDVTEGMSNRPDQVYELNKIGYDAQKEYAVEMLSQIEQPLKCISGNHDDWHLKANGALIVKDICKDLKENFKKDVEYLGINEGDLSLKGKAVVKLWHGHDSSSYAISYRLQKLAEAFTGGEKPHMVLAGHTHKQGYFMIRFIHMISGGAICTQSRWMRGKRLENHTGFWIIEVTVNKSGIARVKPEWFPFYA